MAFASLSGLAILRAEISEPQFGNWTASLALDSEAAPTGAVTFNIGTAIYSGSVVRSGVEGGNARALVEGGKGGLRRVLPARYYYAPTLGVVVKDVLRLAGEALASDSGDLAYAWPRWWRTSDHAGANLRTACQAAGVSWRVKRDGSVWFGKETWPELVAKMTERRNYAALGAKAYSPDDGPDLLPGVTFDGQRVSSVITMLTPNALVQEVWFAEP